MAQGSSGRDGGNLFHALHPRRLIPELCQQFYDQGWFSGTGGGISIKQGNSIYVAPSGVQKERLEPNDLFILKPDGSISQYPPAEKKLTLSQCTPLFMNAYNHRKANAVIHSHGKFVVLASLIYPGSEFRIKNIEMIKGIYHPVHKRMYRYDEELIIPIIENTCFEKDLKDSMLSAMRRYPQTNAVIVRRHGIYVWGDSWQQCKTMSESYHYLCEMAVEMERLGINEYTHAGAESCSSAEISYAGMTPEVEVKQEASTPTQTAVVKPEQQQTPKLAAKPSSPVKKTPTSAGKKTPNKPGGVRGGRINKPQRPMGGNRQGPWQGPPIWNGPGGPMPPPMMMMMGPQMGPMMGPMFRPPGMHMGGRGKRNVGGQMRQQNVPGKKPNNKKPQTRGNKISDSVIMNY